MKLIPISEHPDHAKILYDLLAERTPEQSISHKKMPTWEEHLSFIDRMAPGPNLELEIRLGDPRYLGWFLIQEGEAIVGSVYLTANRNEIGVSIFKKDQRRGCAGRAIWLLVGKFGPANYFANINPANEPSRKTFERLGFTLAQHTYRLEVK